MILIAPLNHKLAKTGAKVTKYVHKIRSNPSDLRFSTVQPISFRGLKLSDAADKIFKNRRGYLLQPGPDFKLTKFHQLIRLKLWSQYAVSQTHKIPSDASIFRPGDGSHRRWLPFF